jgi:LuxR family transcriptional regulator, maltose regulon positive regulatory protein
MATRQLQAADTQMHAAIGLMRGGVTPSRHAYGLLWAAKLARARGDLSAATRLIGEAEDLLCAFEDAGTLSGLLRDVRDAIAQTPATTRPRPRRADRGRARHPTTDARPRLPARDRQALSISINTVKTHRASIYRKLDVSCRQDAVARAVDHGLI